MANGQVQEKAGNRDHYVVSNREIEKRRLMNEVIQRC